MLPVGSRLTRRDEFATVLRRGRRSGRARLVVHLHRTGDGSDNSTAHGRSVDGTVGGTGTRAGFVVSKAVGNAVVRHRVTRRLRHVVAPRLASLPADALLVVRALPAAADATSRQLAGDLDAGLRKLSPADAQLRGAVPTRSTAPVPSSAQSSSAGSASHAERVVEEGAP